MGAHTAPDASRTLEALIVLGITANIDSHLTVGAAIAAGDAHVILDRNTKPAEFLD